MGPIARPDRQVRDCNAYPARASNRGGQCLRELTGSYRGDRHGPSVTSDRLRSRRLRTQPSSAIAPGAHALFRRIRAGNGGRFAQSGRPPPAGSSRRTAIGRRPVHESPQVPSPGRLLLFSCLNLLCKGQKQGHALSEHVHILLFNIVLITIEGLANPSPWPCRSVCCRPCTQAPLARISRQASLGPRRSRAAGRPRYRSFQASSAAAMLSARQGFARRRPTPA